MFGRMHVAPLAAHFLIENPRVQIDMQLTDSVVSMVDEGIDISIRFGELHDSSLIAIPLGYAGRVLCAAPSYWGKHPLPQHPQDLKLHQCLASRGLNQERGWLFRIDEEERYWPINTSLYCNDSSALIRVAQEGAGIAQVMSYHVAADLAAGKLVTALDHCAPKPQPIHAVYPGGKLLPAKVRAILDDWVPKLRVVLQANQ